MEVSIHLHTLKSGCFIEYIEGLDVINVKEKLYFLSLLIHFVIANSVDPDEMPHIYVVYVIVQLLNINSSKKINRIESWSSNTSFKFLNQNTVCTFLSVAKATRRFCIVFIWITCSSC